MKTQWIVGTAALLATAAVGLQAQSSNGSGDQQSTITVTGCLQPDTDRGAVGTSGSSAGRPAAGAAAGSANASNGPFVLVNARVGSAPGGGSAVTSIAPPGSGTNESAARAGSAQPSPAISGAIDKNGDSDKSATGTYLLRGDNAELPRHAGQEVEISGRIVSAATTGSSGSAAAPTSSAAASTSGAAAGTGAGASTTAAQTLEVKTLRMIASVCAAR